jgi:hypothetical protein
MFSDILKEQILAGALIAQARVSYNIPQLFRQFQGSILNLAAAAFFNVLSSAV